MKLAISVVCAVTVLVTTIWANSSITQGTNAFSPAVRITLRAIVTPARSSSRERASADVELAVGQSKQLTFATLANLCGSAIGDTVNMSLPGSPRHVWTVRFTLLSAQTDEIMVDVEIEREDDIPASTHQELRHLVLAEGASHVLDFAESSDRTCAANAFIEMSAGMIDTVSAARQMFRYDIWLTHRDASGHEWTRHEVRTAPHGARSEFRFAPFRWSTLALMPALQIDHTVEEHVFGALRGRRLGDGRFELSLSMSRQLVHDQGATGEERGEKLFTAQLGETIAIELPAAAGQSGVMIGSSARTLLNYGELFKGHTTTVILTVTPLPAGMQ